MTTHEQSPNGAKAEAFRRADILIKQIDAVRENRSLSDQERTRQIADLEAQVRAQRAISGHRKIIAGTRPGPARQGPRT